MTPNLVRSCPKCEYKTVIFTNLKHHQRIHTNERPFKCVHDGCGKTFRQKIHLTNHSFVHTYSSTLDPDDDDTRKSFHCPVCPKKFLRKGSLYAHGSKTKNLTSAQHRNLFLTGHKRHKRRPKDPTNVTCYLCQRKFRKPYEVKVHMRVHTKEKPFNCPECLFNASHQMGIQVHIKRIHRNEKAFECRFCNYRSVTKNELNIHMRIHTGEKPFKCPIVECDYAGRSARALQCHKHSHLNRSKLKCGEGCTYQATSKSDLKRHEKGHRLFQEADQEEETASEEEEEETDENEDEEKTSRRRTRSKGQVPQLKELKIYVLRLPLFKCRKQPCTFLSTAERQLALHECQDHPPPQVQLTRMTLRFKIFELDDGRSFLMSTSMLEEN